MLGALHHMIHLSRRMDGQRMLLRVGPRRYKVRHFSDMLELLFASLREQTKNDIFQGNDPNAQLDEFCVRQSGDIPLVAGGC